MLNRRVQGKKKIGSDAYYPGKPPGEEAAGESPLGRRIFSPRNVASILLTLVVLYLVYRELLGLDRRQVWQSVRGANVALFALAFMIFYCSFPLRALRWEALLENVGYGHATGQHRIPSAFSLTRIMYLAWFINYVTVARLGDVYRGYLLRKEASVSFAVTLGTVLAERFLDLLVVAGLMEQTWPKNARRMTGAPLAGKPKVPPTGRRRPRGSEVGHHEP